MSYLPACRHLGCTDAIDLNGELNLGLDLNEDALTRACVGRVNHIVAMAPIDIGQTTRTTRIVQRLRVLHHIRDAIFQLPKDVGAMIDAKTVARAEVLIDPYPHDL